MHLTKSNCWGRGLKLAHYLLDFWFTLSPFFSLRLSSWRNASTARNTWHRRSGQHSPSSWRWPTPRWRRGSRIEGQSGGGWNVVILEETCSTCICISNTAPSCSMVICVCKPWWWQTSSKHHLYSNYIFYSSDEKVIINVEKPVKTQQDNRTIIKQTLRTGTAYIPCQYP